MKKNKTLETLSFEEHLDNAKQIIQKLESGNCNLDEMLKMYEEGISSLNFCSKKLNEFEEKIQIINNKNNKDIE
tara:strand:- start:320 stop:541 length:222 start_codon:yes stop_codon:yes gene_type:complete